MADLNGDGKPDILSADPNFDAVTVLVGNGDGTFQPGLSSTSYLAGNQPGSLVVGDFNGDGHPDVAVTNVGPGPFGPNFSRDRRS